MIRKFRRKTIDIYAMQNDGSNDIAETITAWVNGHGGTATAMYRGTVLEEPDKAYILVDNPRSQKIAAPGYWVVSTPENGFFVVSDRDFHYLYEEIPNDIPEPPS